MTEGDAVTRGMTMDRLVECPLCKGLGCVICHETGVVKQRNLDRAREPLPDLAWSEAALLRLWRMVVGPLVCRRERTRQQRRWLEEMDQQSPSRLDAEDKRERGLE